MQQAQTSASGGSWWRDRLGRPRDVLNITLWVRFLVDRVVIVPAARMLPLGAALWLADAVGFADALVPSRTSTAAQREIAACTSIGGLRGRRLAAARLAAPRRNLAYLVRMRSGQERAERWAVVQRNSGPVAELISSGQPFIVATGHFLNAAAMLRYKVLTMETRMVSGAVPRWMLAPAQLRRRLLSQAAKAALPKFYRPHESREDRERRYATVPDFWSLSTNWASAPTRVPEVQERALAELRVPGATVSIFSDVFWEKPGAYRRPFAGMADRGFAVGTARIARLSGCPVVPFVAIHGPGQRTVTITWGDPIEPGSADDKGADVRVMDTVIDFIERQVALHPTHYLDPIGHGRRWDAAQEKWVAVVAAPNPGRASAMSAPHP